MRAPPRRQTRPTPASSSDSHRPAELTLARVGERAGCSRSLATHHFGSKAVLVERVADSVTRQFREAMLAVTPAGSTAADDLLALVDVYLDVLDNPRPENRARLALIADAVAHADAEAREVVVAASLEFRSVLVERLSDAADRGELPPDVDPDAFAVVVVGLLRGVAFEAILDPSIDLRAVRDEIAALVTARLVPTAR